MSKIPKFKLKASLVDDEIEAKTDKPKLIHLAESMTKKNSIVVLKNCLEFSESSEIKFAEKSFEEHENICQIDNESEKSRQSKRLMKKKEGINYSELPYTRILGKMYRCNNCKKDFSNINFLTEHVSKRHANDRTGGLMSNFEGNITSFGPSEKSFEIDKNCRADKRCKTSMYSKKSDTSASSIQMISSTDSKSDDSYRQTKYSEKTPIRMSNLIISRFLPGKGNSPSYNESIFGKCDASDDEVEICNELSRKRDCSRNSNHRLNDEPKENTDHDKENIIMNEVISIDGMSSSEDDFHDGLNMSDKTLVNDDDSFQIPISPKTDSLSVNAEFSGTPRSLPSVENDKPMNHKYVRLVSSFIGNIESEASSEIDAEERREISESRQNLSIPYIEESEDNFADAESSLFNDSSNDVTVIGQDTNEIDAKIPKDQSAVDALKDDFVTDASKDDFATNDLDEDQDNSPDFDNSFSKESSPEVMIIKDVAKESDAIDPQDNLERPLSDAKKIITNHDQDETEKSLLSDSKVREIERDATEEPKFRESSLERVSFNVEYHDSTDQESVNLDTFVFKNTEHLPHQSNKLMETVILSSDFETPKKKVDSGSKKISETSKKFVLKSRKRRNAENTTKDENPTERIEKKQKVSKKRITNEENSNSKEEVNSKTETKKRKGRSTESKNKEKSSRTSSKNRNKSKKENKGPTETVDLSVSLDSEKYFKDPGSPKGIGQNQDDANVEALNHDCEFCKMTFHRHKDMTNHVETIHLKKQPEGSKFKGQKSCELCTFKATTKEVVVKHFFDFHNVTKPLKAIRFCTQCDSRGNFFSIEGLNLHVLRRHVNPKWRHACNFCPFRFQTEIVRDIHQTTMHPED